MINTEKIKTSSNVLVNGQKMPITKYVKVGQQCDTLSEDVIVVFFHSLSHIVK